MHLIQRCVKDSCIFLKTGTNESHLDVTSNLLVLFKRYEQCITIGGAKFG